MHIINDDDVMLRFDHDDDIFEGQTGQLVNDDDDDDLSPPWHQLEPGHRGRKTV